MKTPHLLASLAVAATAVAAGLRYPAEVAREWSEHAIQLPPRTDNLSLHGTTTPPLQAVGPMRLPAPLQLPRLNGDVLEVNPKVFPDQRMILAVPNETPPKGAKPWYYRGQKYWLIPIAASATSESPVR
jgi:hypothetical protein